VPVVRDVDKLTIPHIAQSLTQLAEKAKATQYSLEDLRGGSFTISIDVRIGLAHRSLFPAANEMKLSHRRRMTTFA